MRLRLVYRTLNVLLLLMMLCVIAAFAYWKLTPKKLNASGQDIVADYVAKGEARAEMALATLSEGDSSFAEKTLIDWDDIGNDDRYFKHKRKIMLALSKHLRAKGEYLKSTDFLSSSIRENDRDIMLFIEWVKSALNLPDLEQRAAAELRVMAKRFPDHASLNAIYIKDVLYKLDEAAASEALSQIRGLTPKVGGWSVLWTLGSSKRYKKRVWIKLKSDENLWALDILPPKTATTFRVDPPPNVRLDISDIRFVSEGQSMAYDLTEVVEVNMMEPKESVLSANGENNPYFVIAAPEWLKTSSGKADVKAQIVFKIKNVGLDAVPSK